MSELSNYLEDAVVNFWLRGNPGSLTSPATVYLALFTAVTDAEAGTATECAFSGYSRQAVTFGAPSNGATSNTNEITVTKNDAGDVTITHGAIMDASTGGNPLTAVKALAAPKTLAQTDVIRFQAGEIDVAIA